MHAGDEELTQSACTIITACSGALSCGGRVCCMQHHAPLQPYVALRLSMMAFTDTPSRALLCDSCWPCVQVQEFAFGPGFSVRVQEGSLAEGLGVRVWAVAHCLARWGYWPVTMNPLLWMSHDQC